MARHLPTLRRKNSESVVTLTDSKLHLRRDFYCGPWGSAAARMRYAEIIDKWEQSDRRWPCQDVKEGITIAELIVRYCRWAQTNYSSGECFTIRCAWKVLESCYADLPAESFGPIKLRHMRDAMIGKGWNRNYVNQQVHRICAMFRWAARNELLPITVYHTLKSTPPLKRGHTTAPEPKAVRPVSIEHIEAIRPWVSRQVWAIVQSQLLTGARPSELLRLRRGDIGSFTGDVWKLTLVEHKTLHQGEAANDLLRPASPRNSFRLDVSA